MIIDQFFTAWLGTGIICAVLTMFFVVGFLIWDLTTSDLDTVLVYYKKFARLILVAFLSWGAVLAFYGLCHVIVWGLF